MKKYFMVLSAVLLFLSSCASTSVKRVDAKTQTDLSGYWNDTDVRIVCDALINNCLNSQSVDRAIRAMGGKTPVVLVGKFKNESSEHIDTGIITSIMEEAILNSGKMKFVSGGSTRDALRAERQDQQSNASEATAAQLANETGANFMLFGTVKTIIDRADNKTVRTYWVTAEMTNVSTNELMWKNTNSDIKKIVTQAKNKL